MSAGNFVLSFYEDDKDNIYPIRVQPETLAANIGAANAGAAGPADVPVYARTSGGRREYGDEKRRHKDHPRDPASLKDSATTVGGRLARSAIARAVTLVVRIVGSGSAHDGPHQGHDPRDYPADDSEADEHPNEQDRLGREHPGFLRVGELHRFDEGLDRALQVLHALHE